MLMFIRKTNINKMFMKEPIKFWQVSTMKPIDVLKTPFAIP